MKRIVVGAALALTMHAAAFAQGICADGTQCATDVDCAAGACFGPNGVNILAPLVAYPVVCTDRREDGTRTACTFAAEVGGTVGSIRWSVQPPEAGVISPDGTTVTFGVAGGPYSIQVEWVETLSTGESQTHRNGLGGLYVVDAPALHSPIVGRSEVTLGARALVPAARRRR